MARFSLLIQVTPIRTQQPVRHAPLKYTANPFDAAIQLQTLYRLDPGDEEILCEVAKSYVSQFEQPLRAADLDLQHYQMLLKQCLKERLVH